MVLRGGALLFANLDAGIERRPDKRRAGQQRRLFLPFASSPRSRPPTSAARFNPAVGAFSAPYGALRANHPAYCSSKLADAEVARRLLVTAIALKRFQLQHGSLSRKSWTNWFRPSCRVCPRTSWMANRCATAFRTGKRISALLGGRGWGGQWWRRRIRPWQKLAARPGHRLAAPGHARGSRGLFEPHGGDECGRQVGTRSFPDFSATRPAGLGGTGNLPVPPGNLPGGTGAASGVQADASMPADVSSRSVGLVAPTADIRRARSPRQCQWKGFGPLRAHS